MHTLNKYLIYLLVLISISCVFQSDDEFFVEIDTSNVEIPQLDFFASSDTVYIRGITSILIEISENTQLIGYEMLIGNQVIFDGTSYRSNISINSSEYSDGFYTMTLKVITKSNTGSLADKLESEVLITEYSKIGIVDNRPVIAQVIGFKVENGVLSLNWNRYLDYHFEKVEIVFNSPFRQYNSTLTDPNIVQLEVPDFNAGRISAEFALFAKNEVVKLDVNFRDTLNFNIELIESELYLTMSANPYLSNERMIIKHNNDINNSGMLFQEYLLENRTYDHEKINIQQNFPNNFDFWLETSSSMIQDYYIDGENFVHNLFPTTSGNNIEFYIYDNEIVNFSLTSSFSGENNIKVLDRTSGALIKELTGILDLSPNGKWLYELRDTLLVQYDPENLNRINAVILSDYLDIEGEIKRFYVTDSNQILFYSFLRHDPFGQRTDYNSYLWDNSSRQNLRTRFHRNELLNPNRLYFDIGGKLTSSGNFFLNIEPNRQAGNRFFIPFVSTTENDLLGSGNLLGILLSSDTYLIGEGSMLVKRDYSLHEIIDMIDLGGDIIEVISNYDELVAVIILNNEDYEIVILNTSDFSEKSRLSFNPTAIDSEKRFIKNHLLVSYNLSQIHTLEIDE